LLIDLFLKIKEVFKGVYVVGGAPVALKYLKDQNIRDLVAELSILGKLSHPNIIRLLGIYTSSESKTFIVTEYASKGNLQEFLQTNHETLIFQKFFPLAIQIATAMVYLEKSSII